MAPITPLIPTYPTPSFKRTALALMIGGLVLIGVATGSISVLANDSAKSSAENTTDVSRNPITGNTTVTEKSEVQDESKPGVTKKMKKKVVRKYNRDGKKIDEKQSSEEHSEEK